MSKTTRHYASDPSLDFFKDESDVKVITYNPDEDGITHINVYSKGQTELGRFLSNFTRSSFVCEDGAFESIEGYWYWLGTTDPAREELRKMYGWQAKEYGRQIRALDWQNSPEFKEKICKAITIKLLNNPQQLELLKANTLPLTHYYVYGGKAVDVKDGKWILEHIKSLAE